MQIKIKKNNQRVILPSYQTTHSAGADVRACLTETLVLKPMQRAMIPTGFSMEIPEGYEVQIRPRSGLASKGLIIPNSPGTIDSDYRGEVKILVLNLSDGDFEIQDGDRVAQMVVQKVHQSEFVESESLSDTQRGEGGFGHTGVR